MVKLIWIVMRKDETENSTELTRKNLNAIYSRPFKNTINI